MSDRAEAPANPSAGELAAVAELWKRERRLLNTTFGGTSMLPAIAPGQQVAVLCGVEPEIGEVVMLLRDDQVGVHRLVARGRDTVLTWGDANLLPDEPILLSRVIGTIRGVPLRPRSAFQALLLLWLRPDGDVAALRFRLQRAYSVVNALRAGPAIFVRRASSAIWRRLLRHIPTG